MNVTTISRSLLGGLLSAIVILQPASAAGTLSGQIGVQVTLGSGCSVSTAGWSRSVSVKAMWSAKGS